jgi:hypothetical protein
MQTEEEFAPLTVEYVPAGQEEQLEEVVMPVKVEKEPAGQSTQKLLDPAPDVDE